MARVFLAAFLLLYGAAGLAEIINAASCSEANVASAIAAAAVGDTVQVPAGSCTWSTLAIAKAVTIKGAGIGSTNITLGTGNTITKQAAGIIRIRDFSFSRSGGGNGNYGFQVGGAWKSAEPIIVQANAFTVSGSGLFRVDVAGGFIFAGNTVTGAWDDSFLQMKNIGGLSTWTSNSTMGTADTNGKWNLYIEGNTFTGGTNQGIDCDDAARCVFRHNVCNYMSFNSHGLDTSQVGVRHFEVYSNQFRNDSAGGWTGGTGGTDTSNQNWAIWIRGGTGVIYNNVIDDIANSYWGYGKSEAKFDIRAQQDNSGSGYGWFADGRAWYSAGQGVYPRQHQLAVSWDEALSNSVGINGGVGNYFIDPIYVWGNTGAGASGGSFLDWANGGSWGSQTGYFNAARDYVFGNTPKPGYTAYAYPHPLLGGALLSAPTNLRWNQR